MYNRTPFFIRLIQGLTNLIFTIIELLLLARIVLIFFRADSTSTFVSWIFTKSESLVSPFKNVFGSQPILDSFTLDFDALLAWFVYLVLYIIIVEFLRFLNSLIRDSRAQQY